MISAPLSVGEVCTRLRREYAVEEEICRRDVIALLSSLREAGLVQVIDRQNGTNT
jgi:hypothetical protein